ncbi:MAG: C39 family peptidase [Ardenticatenaceae bacterium]|nr:C39 family peptidase [Ardenticatenaceae bacterium]
MPKQLLPVPHHKQKAESDCLAACTAMMLATLNIQLPYTRLLSILDIKPWGTPHRNIQKLAELAPGVHVIYKQGTITDLFQLLDTGKAVVVFVWTGDLPYWHLETWHAVVIIGYDEHYFYLNDPAFDDAPQAVSHGDLDLAWIAYDTFFAVIEKL